MFNAYILYYHILDALFLDLLLLLHYLLGW